MTGKVVDAQVEAMLADPERYFRSARTEAQVEARQYVDRRIADRLGSRLGARRRRRLGRVGS